MPTIRTTHVGSLPRSPRLAECLLAKERGVPVDEAAFDRLVSEEVAAVVVRQKAVGIDVPSDGEAGKISYATYVAERFSGFAGDSPRRPPADLAAHPGYMERLARCGGTPSYRRPRCVGPIRLADDRPLRRDIGAMRAALAAAGYADGFLTAASPGVVALFQPSDVHPTLDAYLEDLAEALRGEYEAIVEAGLLLQIDAPDLGLGRHMLYAELDEAGFLARAERHVAVLRAALRDVPRERLRLHVCWGNYEGPHTHDVALAAILPLVLGLEPGFLLFEAANPRHAHEWRVFEEVALPEGLVLVPGCIDSTTNFVEHPELVAERIGRFVDLVGAERVMAGTDCGFATFAGYGAVDAEIAWEKLAALVEGAAIASRRLAGSSRGTAA